MTKTLATSDRRMNQLFPTDRFDSLLTPFFKIPFLGFSPRMFEWEKTDEGFKLEANLPKFKKEDVSVSVEGNMLTIEGKREDRPFFMEMSIPAYADTSSIKAKLEDGMLTVSANQLESTKAKTIQIE